MNQSHQYNWSRQSSNRGHLKQRKHIYHNLQMGQLCLKILIPYLENPSEETTWDEVFKNGPSEICGREPLKNLK